jgi:hypothetical protein
MKIKSCWVSYDLGLKGDYNNLYTWLDNQQAVECGDSIAYFKFKSNNNFIEEIKKSLLENVDFRKSDRVYMIYLDTDDGNKIKGKFLVGHRKRAPWESFSDKSFNTEVDSE